MRFTATIDARTDEKGRVFVPKVFRTELEKEKVEALVLRRDIFENCLVLFPKDVWDGLVDEVKARTNFFDREQRQALRLFTVDVENITLDSGGRMLIPRRYLEYAGIKNDVRFMGVDDKIEIWSKEAAEEVQAKAVSEAGNILSELMRPI